MKNLFFKTAITYVVIVVLFLVSLCFSSSIETFLKLKPDLKQINSTALEVHFVDVGQGDAILVKNNGKTMLIDSGNASKEKQLLTYINNVFFRNETNKMFNYVILTHSDADHSGNMLSILENYEVETFFRPKIYVEGLESVTEQALYETNMAYVNLIAKLKALKHTHKINVEYAEMGISFNLSDAQVNILAPVKNYYSSSNEYSAVVTVEKNDSKFMFTGDATIDNELEIINNNSSSLLNVDVLKLGHHGSNTSTSLSFLEATSPSFAIVSVGEFNAENHPSSEVLNNIVSYNLWSNTTTSVLQTANLGNIVCYVNDDFGVCYTTIANVFDYLFVSWWVLVVIVVLVVTIVCGAIILIKWLKQGKTSKL